MTKRIIAAALTAAALALTACSGGVPEAGDMLADGGSALAKGYSWQTTAAYSRTNGDVNEGNAQASAEAEYAYGAQYDMMFAPSEVAPGVVMPGADDFNAEEYSAITENRFRSVKNEPLSTFSADVDTASYTTVRRMLLEDRASDLSYIGEAVRIEEMLNYFRYDYAAPTDGKPFSVTTEYADCPWNADTKLLLIGLQASELDMSEAPRSNLVFLIDVSGSMDSPDKLPLARRAFALLAESLREGDRVSVVVYAGTDSVLLEGADGADTKAITDVTESLMAGGSTHGSAGITTAYEIARKYYIEGGNNRVILATDGDLNVGVTSEAELKSLVETERESGVFFSVLGFGTGNYKDNKLETLADNGNGSYHYIDSAAEARRVLLEEAGATLFTVAKDVKLQVEFNPTFVKGYRLIGYETRMLATEDFADDAKDAGDIGAGHRVTALYEIVTADSPVEIPETELKYQSAAAPVGSDELLTVSLRYKAPDSDVSELAQYPVRAEAYTAAPSESFRFAASVAAFGQLLRQSEFVSAISFADVYAELGALPSVAADPYKTELLYLVSLLAK